MANRSLRTVVLTVKVQAVTNYDLATHRKENGGIPPFDLPEMSVSSSKTGTMESPSDMEIHIGLNQWFSAGASFRPGTFTSEPAHTLVIRLV